MRTIRINKQEELSTTGKNYTNKKIHTNSCDFAELFMISGNAYKLAFETALVDISKDTAFECLEAYSDYTM